MIIKMKISQIRTSPQNNVSSQHSSLDNHENELRKQITDLQEEKKSISNDKEKTSEEKKKEKQAVQEEIQTLSSELRQYKIQKRQEEAARKQEALKETFKDAREQDTDSEQNPEPVVFGSEESGVLISLSATKEQISGMKRIRTELERRHRTAATDQEKADLQKKVNHLMKHTGRKVTITEGSMPNSRTSKNAGTGTNQISDQAFDWKSQAELIDITEEPEISYRGNLIANRKKFFSTVSVFIS